jgi:hypothetical protein
LNINNIGILRNIIYIHKNMYLVEEIVDNKKSIIDETNSVTSYALQQRKNKNIDAQYLFSVTPNDLLQHSYDNAKYVLLKNMIK